MMKTKYWLFPRKTRSWQRLCFRSWQTKFSFPQPRRKGSEVDIKDLLSLLWWTVSDAIVIKYSWRNVRRGTFMFFRSSHTWVTSAMFQFMGNQAMRKFYETPCRSLTNSFSTIKMFFEWWKRITKVIFDICSYDALSPLSINQ
jgi:hypothetical protein